MSQPNSQQPFTKKVHKEVYPAISSSQPSLSVKGKTVLVTGATQGIGYAIATAYAAAGAANVIVTGQNAERLASAKTSLEREFPATKAQTYSASVDDNAATVSLFAEIRANIAEPDILVLNAGNSSKPGPVLQIPDGALQKDFDVNVKGNLDYVIEFLKPEALTKEKVILNVSTTVAHFVARGLASYSATKMTMVNLLMHVQEEYAEKNVRVISFHPGAVFTSLARSNGYDEDSFPYDDGT